MQMLKKRSSYYITITVLFFLYNSCSKGGGENDSSDSLKYYIITSLEPAGPGVNSQNLNILNPDGSIRWRKTNRGFSNGFAFTNGKMFAAHVDNPNGMFHAYDINTGSEIWSKVSPSEFFYSPTYRNDTLFCGLAIPVSPSVSNGYIAAYNANTGALYWKKQVTNPFWPGIMKLEGNTLYFIYTAMPGAIITIVSFNLTSQTINWTLPLGLAVTTAPQAMIDGDKILITDGLKRLKAASKQNQAQLWMNTVVPYDNFSFSDNTIYATSLDYSGFTLDGIYAIDANTGVQKWHWQGDWLTLPWRPLPANGKVFIAGHDGSSTPHFITAINASNGTTAWTSKLVYSNPNIKYPVAVGNRVYLAVEKQSSNFAVISSHIHSFNTSDGQSPQTINFPIPQAGILFMSILSESGKIW